MTIKDSLEEYVEARQELDNILLRKKELEEKRDNIEGLILGHLDANPHEDRLISKKGFKAGRGVKRFSEITDWSALQEWASVEGDDYIGGCWDELQSQYKMKDVKPGIFIWQPNKKLLNVMLKHYADLAEKAGISMADLLPPGLQQQTTDFIRLTKPTKKVQRDEFLQTAEDNLVEMARRGALGNE